jgi:hypothetical protein
MRRGQFDAIESLMKAHGLNVSSSMINAIISIVENYRDVIYEVGDFIAFNEGMGEQGYGTIIKTGDTRVAVEVFGYQQPSQKPYSASVGIRDISGLATENDAMEYFAVRNGLT